MEFSEHQPSWMNANPICQSQNNKLLTTQPTRHLTVVMPYRVCPVDSLLKTLDSDDSRKSYAFRLLMTLRIFGEPKGENGKEDIYAYRWETLDYTQVLDFREHLKNHYISPRTNKRYSDSSINATLEAIKGVAKQAFQLGMMTGDTYQRIYSIKSVKNNGIRRKRAPLPKKERAKLVKPLEAIIADPYQTDAARHLALRDRAIIAFLFATGVRSSEVCSITLDDYGPSGTIIRGKGSKDRWIYPQKDLIAHINAWLAVRPSEGDRLFCHLRKDLRGKPLTRDNIRALISRAVDASGVEPMAPHDTRRTFATTALNLLNNDLPQVASLMGHSNVDTTAKYCVQSEDKRRESARILGENGL